MIDSLSARGESVVISACLAHMKVFFIPKQLLFTRRSYCAMPKSHLALTVGDLTTSLQKYIEGIWSKLGLFGPYFLFFNLKDAQKHIEMVEYN